MGQKLLPKDCLPAAAAAQRSPRSADNLSLKRQICQGFPLSEARGKDGPFIPCYARLPLEFPKAGVTRRIRLLCAALCAACTRARRCVVRAPVYLLNCLELKPDMCDIVTMFL